MKPTSYLAMDYGASSGRGILGHFDGTRIVLEEVHRFENYFVDQNGTFYWDVFRLFHEMRVAIEKASRRAPGLRSVGIDTWGTDYGLLDKNGQLIGNPRCMRNADGSVVARCREKISIRELFDRTGIQMIYGNTVFQLYERVLAGDPALENGACMLMMPDLLAYMLTGERFNEYTMASTSMLYNVHTRSWDLEVARRLGIPETIFGQILLPGSRRFPVRKALCADMNIPELEYVPVGSHDTASAVAAIPLEADVAFCSSGTWSIFGIASDTPVLSEQAYEANFSNEGTVDGKIRLLKNIMGMWILQQCAAQWKKQGLTLSWDEIVAEAEKAPPFRSFINLEEPEFYCAGDMVSRIQDYCRRTHQPVPETVGEIARCAYESLAMRYRYTIGQLEEITGRPMKALHIVGGGCKNRLLNQFAANAIGRPVYAGPVESACVGNILMQAYAYGEIKNLAHLRQVVRNSFPVETYLPEDPSPWQAAYSRYLRHCK